MDSDVDDELIQNVRKVMDSDRDNAGSSNVAKQLDIPSSDAGIGELETAVDGFRILKELGRGGMGAVFLAEQESTKRQVALKVLLQGPFASEVSRKRFEREVELAAYLDHRNIVTILESGISSGRFYFAMTYVEGCELDKYVKDKSLSPKAILTLFSKVCRAISYAHQRGIIHRDIKPSNILVDKSGEPQILDFGLAKVIDPEMDRLRSDRLLSAPGQPVGTLPYMSPEQTTGMQHDLDVRTDVYSLGLVLFRLLTRTYAYKVLGDVAEVLRNINEVDAATPSSIRSDIDTDIDTLVLKTLNKDRERRYQSADALANDIDRYLSGRPIQARQDSTWYVARKLIWRNRVPLSIAAVIAMLIAATTFGLLRQRRHRHQAVARSILTSLVGEPEKAASAIAQANTTIRQLVSDSVQHLAQSSAYTDRVTAGRGGLLAAPQAYWDSIDGGPLWEFGEWLELCKSPELLTPETLNAIRHVAKTGTQRQKYVAFCLLGQLAKADDNVTATLCDKAAGNEQQPGVAMAAWWAARRLGIKSIATNSNRLFQDNLTQMTFVELPSTVDFRRGSDRSDTYRYDDEARSESAVAIDSIYMSSTEITRSAIAAYLASSEQNAPLVNLRRRTENALSLKIPQSKMDSVAAGLITLEAAKSYCSWLSEKGASANPARRYRLPTEDEWEYAARAGSAERFCYGRDTSYARFFANCDGSSTFHIAGERMPNWYGLFDMHGGLWEWTSSKYPLALVAQQGIEDQKPYVIRGGAFYSPAARCRSAQRNYKVANAADDYMGARLVMEIIKP